MCGAFKGEGSGGKRCVDGGCGGNERIDLGELEELDHVGAGRDRDDANSFAAATDVVAHDCSERGGVHLRDCGDIEDVKFRRLIRGSRLEFEDVAESDLLHGAVHIARVEWSGDAIDQGAGRLAFDAFNGECGALPEFGLRD